MGLSFSKLIYDFAGKGMEVVVNRFTRRRAVESDEQVLERQIAMLDHAIVRGQGEQPWPPQLLQSGRRIRLISDEPVIAEEAGLTTEETLAYQKREIGKELLVLESHLAQKCKIEGTPCDCCSKHPLKLEALAEETLGMTTDPIFGELARWTKEISSMTTEEASRSGQYDEDYANLAVTARNFRKQIVGTAKLSALVPQDESPITLEDAKKLAADKAAKRIEEAWEEA